jgi:ribonuclease HII
MLLPYMREGIVEAGCDEAGRGCLCGPVACAAVILPDGFADERLNDSKQLKASVREQLRTLIEHEALAWAVVMVDAAEIDKLNILRASITGMHRAVDKLAIRPQHIIVDGNKFTPHPGIEHTTVVKGDAKYMSIAAASILAKTHRDELMMKLAKEYPGYGWERNMGYPTVEHRKALMTLGLTPYHRRSFAPCQPSLFD